MAIDDAYATVEEYRSEITKGGNPGDNSDILADMKAISRWLDRQLGRTGTGFNKDTTATDRLFMTPYGGQVNPEAENPWKGLSRSRHLYVDDIADITDLAIVVDQSRDGSFVGDAALSANDYVLYPMNAPLGPEPRPYWDIYLTPWGTTNLLGWIPATEVKITAKWGWPAVPWPIKRATIHLAAILRLETPRATARITQLDQTFGESQDAQNILHNLVKPYRKASL